MRLVASSASSSILRRMFLAACSAVMVLCWPRGHAPRPSRWRDAEQSNGDRGFSRFDVAQFCFRVGDRLRRARRGAARSRRHALGLGWPGGTPHGLGLPPASYKTPPKNTYDPKNPRVGGQKPRAPKSAVIMPRTALGAAAGCV